MIDYYETKQHPITRKMVLDAYERVRANQGSGGIDGESLIDFEKNLYGNLYNLWNRMTSGSYMPKPVREVKIPKKSGGTRGLGIPTISDRIAQQVVKSYLEPKIEGSFHPDSYGYRPGRSGHQAIEAASRRCTKKYAWVVDLDIKGFFDTIDHTLLMKGLGWYTKEKWVMLYVNRWLEAGVMGEEGVSHRERGTPQGGVISPLLANVFLHFAFDKWMDLNYPYIRFERYCDDIVVHAQSKSQAEFIKDKITTRLRACKLELNESKTAFVYCRNQHHLEKHGKVQFDFLGYTFKPRYCPGKTGFQLLFTPCMSQKAKNSVMDSFRRMRIDRRLVPIQQLAKILNPKLRGWINYYCKVNKWITTGLWWQIHLSIIKWIMKIRRMNKTRAFKWLKNVYASQPNLFAHWEFVRP